VDEASLGLDAKAEAGWRAFLRYDATLERYETAFHKPLLSD
jgi:trimethylamine:corrinoid methyltransferase-like protein